MLDPIYSSIVNYFKCYYSQLPFAHSSISSLLLLHAFSSLVLFNPFSFLVCSLLKSWCSMCTRPNLLPNASYDTFFFLVGYRERQHVVVYYMCMCLLGNFIIIMLIPSVMDLAPNRCQGIETHMTAIEKSY